MLKEGDTAPVFSGRDGNGNIIGINDFKGRRLILYFYPKDNTPGCTAEACSLRDGYSQLKRLGYTILGVSPDKESSHLKFSEKNSLPFPLIADTEKEIATAYGVWGEKKFMGKTYMGIIRKTFIINENGIIEKIFDKVRTKDHAEQILENIKQ
ncbi:MAG: thioredoxin-dependent thiol peroxidase [Rikenellaceae bacterium]|nr:thioredoxin-dependent thiol peroxidase [Rikenellaceae bacterium]